MLSPVAARPLPSQPAGNPISPYVLPTEPSRGSERACRASCLVSWAPSSSLSGHFPHVSGCAVGSGSCFHSRGHATPRTWDPMDTRPRSLQWFACCRRLLPSQVTSGSGPFLVGLVGMGCRALGSRVGPRVVHGGGWGGPGGGQSSGGGLRDWRTVSRGQSGCGPGGRQGQLGLWSLVPQNPPQGPTLGKEGGEQQGAE